MSPVRIKEWAAKEANPMLYPRGRLLAVGFSICLPNAATKEDAREWLALHMGCGSMAADNPLGHFDPEAFREITIEDCGIETDYHEAVSDALDEALR